MATISNTISLRLSKESKSLEKYSKNGIRFSKINGNPYKWNVTISDFDKDTLIYKELKQYTINEILFEITIPKTYPFEAPFVRIVKPRFMGYKGFITNGGSLCTDILTHSGWSPACKISTMVIQVKLLIKNARIDKERKDIVYTEAEARRSFNHTTNIHKWGR